MSNVIKGNELKNGNFLIELTAERMDDLGHTYLIKSCNWQEKADNAPSGSREKELNQMIADDYYNYYKQIREIQGK